MKKDASIFDNIDKKLLQKFKKYHTENPSVYEKFVEYSLKIKNVRKKYSAWTVINAIRWDHDVKTGDIFKINNDFISLYARLLIYNRPEFDGFFELRRMKPTDRRDSSEEIYRSKSGNTL